jgi:hypothetical protein
MSSPLDHSGIGGGSPLSGTAGDTQRQQFNKLWSRTFLTNLSEGHTQPAPEFGAPALSWHIAFWPKHDADPNHTDMSFSQLGSSGWSSLFDEFQRKRVELYAPAGEGGEFNSFLVKLQRAGRILRGGMPEELLLRDRPGRIPQRLKFDRLESTYLCFTLWWQDEGEGQTGFVTSDPLPTAIRVRVSVKAFFDHTTVSLYLDAGKPWNEPSVYNSENAVGLRRKKIFKAVEDVRTICQGQLAQGAANLPLVPEPFLDATQAETLYKANEYLYTGIWGDFCRDFEFRLEDIVTSKGRCFANFHGLVMSTDGVASAGEHIPPEQSSWPGVDIPRFGDKPDDGKSEANAVIKAYWPFVRRMTAEADYKDHIACGIMNWRALFITALGAKGTARRGTDWKFNPPRLDIPGDGLPDDYVERDPTIRDGHNQLHQRAVRYLFLTKFEPHRRQIGRIVERMNRLGTIRLFALKGYDFIQNADVHIRILGQELDGITHWWSTQCAAIQNDYREVKKKIQAELEEKYPWLNVYRTAQENKDINLKRERNDAEREAIQAAFDKLVKEVIKPRDKVSYEGRKILDRLSAEKDASLDGVAEYAERQRLRARYEENEWAALIDDRMTSELQKRDDDAKKLRDRKLANVTEDAEKRLIQITAALDELGHASAGGLHYRIGRSSYYIDQFNALVKTLGIGDIPTWIAYNSFAERGLKPLFDMIQQTGTRLQALRGRLTAVTESIQTSALVVQSSATRENTAVLKEIERHLRYTVRFGIPAGSLGILTAWWGTPTFKMIFAFIFKWLGDFAELIIKLLSTLHIL